MACYTVVPIVGDCGGKDFVTNQVILQRRAEAGLHGVYGEREFLSGVSVRRCTSMRMAGSLSRRPQTPATAEAFQVSRPIPMIPRQPFKKPLDRIRSTPLSKGNGDQKRQYDATNKRAFESKLSPQLGR